MNSDPQSYFVALSNQIFDDEACLREGCKSVCQSLLGALGANFYGVPDNMWINPFAAHRAGKRGSEVDSRSARQDSWRNHVISMS